ncbi:VOC family protein [Proteiniclasticum sp. C24MP]|uniref:VOC family protein n=1 Tax=Proteiniclasticum sp. C24MP TaxID=3374101 RepID=UPI00375447CD
MAKVIGVGGLFLEFKGEKEALHRFYKEILGMDMSAYGSGFTEGEQLMLLSFKREGEKMPLINFRVDDLTKLMEILKQKDLETDEIAVYDYGKFAHFTDPFGNYIELWEPEPYKYKEMVRKEREAYLEKR